MTVLTYRQLLEQLRKYYASKGYRDPGDDPEFLDVHSRATRTRSWLRQLGRTVRNSRRHK